MVQWIKELVLLQLGRRLPALAWERLYAWVLLKKQDRNKQQNPGWPVVSGRGRAEPTLLAELRQSPDGLRTFEGLRRLCVPRCGGKGTQEASGGLPHLPPSWPSPPWRRFRSHFLEHSSRGGMRAS